MKTSVVVIVALAIGLGALVVWKTRTQDADAQYRHKAETPVVATATAEIRPVPLIVPAVGTVEAEHSVAVRAQTTGILREVLFREGDKVEADQLLFKIDPRSARTNLDQMKAQLARDQAQLKEAEAQRARLGQLIDREYITRAEYEQAIASATAAAATVDADKAMIEDAKLKLDYSRIRAPISGRTGSLSVKPGNLVGATAASGDSLVVINSIKPILVAFTLPQRHLSDVRQFSELGELKVEISRENDSTAIAQGKLVFIDNNVNPQTGTILLKASVPNDDEALWPGQFVAVRLVLKTEPNAVVVPDRAVQPGQQGSFVYLVKDGKVERKDVKVARQAGDAVVIAEGLRGGEQLIVEIPPNLAVGDAVEVSGDVRPAKATR